jgi:hypothetical protein
VPGSDARVKPKSNPAPASGGAANSGNRPKPGNAQGVKIFRQ